MRLTRHPCRVAHCAIPALGRPQVAMCVAHKFCAYPQNQKQLVSQEEVRSCWRNLLSRFAFCFLLFAFLPQFHRRRKMRVGRPSGGAVGWVARHGCRASAVGPWMARRRVPAPRCRSEGTAAKRGPYASAEVLVTFGTKSDPAVRTEPDSAAPGCCCCYSIQGAVLLFVGTTDIQGAAEGCEGRVLA